uniref:Helicase-associated domain-containing protein n=1 Tax=Eucampia antarctica TaxID=49252 RepID=A0A7S2RFL4_9STRA|mmetsp:Transcript_21585/g.20737  ORF Transcript_21585/g.20737 Transcript_21585/m.20737 type:complete len:326 (+) Transcript_21585:2-979(+)
MDEDTNDLTDLGRCLSVLSLEPRVGKMIIWSYILGCSRAATSMGVAMSYKSPFILPPKSMRQTADQIKVAISEGSESDQITILNVLKTYDNFSRRNKGSGFYQYCRSNFLNFNTVQMIADLRRSIGNELASLGFSAPSSTNPKWHNRNGFTNPAFLQATIAAGLYPNVASRVKGDVNFSTISNRKAKVHISSVNSCQGQPLRGKCQVGKKEIEFIAFGEMVRGVQFFTMSQTSHLASAMPLILMCGNLRVRPANVQGEHKSVLCVDDWINFLCPKDIASALVVLRKRLDVAFAKIVADPSAGPGQLNPEESDAVATLSAVINDAT